MKIYIKELGKDEENVQVLNTSIDKFFMPRVGDSVLISYTVVKIEWISFRSGNETAVLWVQKKRNNLVLVSVYEIIKNKFIRWKTKSIKLTETSIEKTQLTEALIPKVSERLEINGKFYEISTITKIGGLFDFTELKLEVFEITQ